MLSVVKHILSSLQPAFLSKSWFHFVCAGSRSEWWRAEDLPRVWAAGPSEAGMPGRSSRGGGPAGVPQL